MGTAILSGFAAPHQHGDEECNGRFFIKGPKFLDKDIKRLESYANDDGEGVTAKKVFDAMTDFFSTQYKNIVKIISTLAQIIALSMPNTPTGSMAGRVSTLAGDVKNALSVIEIPKKLIEIVDYIVDLTKLDLEKESELNIFRKVAGLFFKKMAELTNLLCDGICLLDRYLVSLGRDGANLVKGVSGVATLVGSLYALLCENVFTLHTYSKNWNSENDKLRPRISECVALGMTIVQNFCFATLGALLVATGLGAVVLSVPWITFAFAVVGFVLLLGVFFVEKIWARPVEVNWVPA